MKKIFLVFGVIFSLIGCADSDDTVTPEKCPITADNFTFKQLGVNKYQIILKDESKRQYVANSSWAVSYYDSVFYKYHRPSIENFAEPIIEYLTQLDTKKLRFEYRSNGCGDMILKPTPLKPNKYCDNISIDYRQRVYYNDTTGFRVIFNDRNQLDKKLKYALIFKDNKTIDNYTFDALPNSVAYDSMLFHTPYDEIEYLKEPDTTIFSDIIIDYPDGSQCRKELFFKR